MAKSALAKTMDSLQGHLRPVLSSAGFKRYGRTYNRAADNGIVDVIGFQMGPFDPPGTEPIPGLRENHYGEFTINLGVYVPEVARYHGGGESDSVVHDYNCCIRTRLGSTDDKEYWWKVVDGDATRADISDLLQSDAFPFFDRFNTRDQILAEFGNATHNTNLISTPRIVCALILFEQGQRAEAANLLAAQACDLETPNRHHNIYVVRLAEKLGIRISQ